MGKKKSKRVAVKKTKTVLDVVFNCLYCAHEHCVEVRMDKASQVGTLSCKICGVTFSSPIHSLSAPVDVYTDWVDEAEKVNQQKPRRNVDDYELTDRDDDEEEGAGGRGNARNSNTSAGNKNSNKDRRATSDDDEEEEEEEEQRSRQKSRGRRRDDSDDDDDEGAGRRKKNRSLSRSPVRGRSSDEDDD